MSRSLRRGRRFRRSSLSKKKGKRGRGSRTLLGGDFLFFILFLKVLGVGVKNDQVREVILEG